MKTIASFSRGIVVVSLIPIFSVLCGVAEAAVLDQENTGPASGGGAVANDRTQSQALTVGVSGVLTQVDVIVRKEVNAFEDLTLSVRSTLGGAPDALLTSVSVPASSVGTVEGLVSFDVSAAGLSFSAGDVIVIDLTTLANNVFPFDERYNWRWYNDDPYPRGQRFTNGLAVSQFDFAFQTFVEPAAIEGDLDGDGFVGINDLNIVLGNWNQNVPPGDVLADPSGDGFVGIDDLNTVLGNWNAGTPPSPEVLGNVPEPGSLVVLGVGGVAILRRRG